MTAFANREIQLPEGQARWEIKSLNHRYFEPSFKLPDLFQDLEYPLREILRQNIHRGKIQCNLYFEQSSPQKKLDVDLAWVDEVIAATRLIQERLKTAGNICPLDILAWPNSIKAPTKKIGTLEEPIKGLFIETLEELIKERAREGSALQQFIKEQLDQMAEILNRIKIRLPNILSLHRERLLEKIVLLKVQLELNRLEQEMVFMAQKMDVTEEINRLETHIKAVTSLMLTSEGMMGRRLDFLMQEFNREANTLASKSMDVTLTQEAVELKVIIEQLREQIQNVE